MRFAVETWSPEYGVSADESQLEDHAGPVDLDVEMPAAEWEPLRSSGAEVRPDVIFVDGVRRIDARIWVTDGDKARQGVCASVAAGAVLCSSDSAKIVDVVVSRGFYAAPFSEAADIQCRNGPYVHVPCVSDSPEDIYFGIHDQMTKLEATVDTGAPDSGGSVEAAGTQQGPTALAESKLVIFDGPLRGRSNPNGVGYVKTQQVQYLPDSHQLTLARLAESERTPLFQISGRGFDKYSWYLRLPSAQNHPLAGVVRCEVGASVGLEVAVARADQSCSTLTFYASRPYRESRAPQNLYPIAGLENQLRHRLGDQQVMERSLRRAASL